MGQYFKFFNFDKKERLSPSDYNNLRKVMEHSYQGNYFMCAAEKLMKTSWKGDRVLYIGDYVNEYYDNPEHKETLAKLVKETNADNLYHVDFKAKKIKLNKGDLLPTRYLYNHDTKEYIDLKKQPIQWSGFDQDDRCIYGTKIHPLSILLCASNGAGGSYYGKNMEYVGKWVNSLGNIELSHKQLDNNYTELNVVFDANETEKSNVEILKETIEKHIKNNEIKNIKEIRFYEDLFLEESEKQELIDYAKHCMFKDTIDFTEFLNNQQQITTTIDVRSSRIIKVPYNENITFLYRQYARDISKMTESDDMSFIGIYDKANNKVYGDYNYLDFLKDNNNDIDYQTASFNGAIYNLYNEVDEKVTLKISSFIENNKERLMKEAKPIFDKWKQSESNQYHMSEAARKSYIKGEEIQNYEYPYSKSQEFDVYDIIKYLEQPDEYLNNLYQEFMDSSKKYALPHYNSNDEHIEVSIEQKLGFCLLKVKETQRLLQNLIQDKNNPYYKKMMIYTALKDSDSVNVSMTVIHNNKELIVTYPTSLLMSFDIYTNRINPVADREDFEELFEDVKSYGYEFDNEVINSITEIKYRGQIIYEDKILKEEQEQNIEDDFDDRDI